MSLSTKPYKGARDFYPDDKRFQKWMFSTWRRVCERYGYEEYDAPILEPTDLYLAKGNQEIIDEQTYTFTDRGGRSVTIRTEMTPTVSRLVAGKRQEISYPARWYSIPNLWRYERPQRGRLREFWQLNVDIFGVAGIEADQEIIQLADAIMQEFGAERDMYRIKLNSRALMDYITRQYLKLDDVQSTTLVRVIDRMHKLPRSEFVALLDGIFSPSQRENGMVDKLLLILGATRFTELPIEILQQSCTLKLAALIELLKKSGITNVMYDPTLMRGFDYYTDIVFEVFDTHPDNNRSMFGGGRYDGLVGQFGVEPVPTFGFGMGDATLENFLETHKLIPQLHTEVDMYAVLIGDVFERAQPVLADLRKHGINMYVDITGRKPAQQMKSAVKKGVPYVLFLGEQELEKELYKIKHLDSGKEGAHSVLRIVTMVKDHRLRQAEEDADLLDI